MNIKEKVKNFIKKISQNLPQLTPGHLPEKEPIELNQEPEELKIQEKIHEEKIKTNIEDKEKDPIVAVLDYFVELLKTGKDIEEAYKQTLEIFLKEEETEEETEEQTEEKTEKTEKTEKIEKEESLKEFENVFELLFKDLKEQS